MKDIRVPGIVWAIAMVAIVAVIHENQAAWNIPVIYSDLAVVVVVGILKTMNLGADQLNQALDIIDNIKTHGAISATRGGGSIPVGMEGSEDPAVISTLTANAPERPNNTVRFLLG